MKLSDDLEKLLISFQDLMAESKELVTENEKNKALVKEKEAELAEQSAKCEQLERNLKQQQELLELYNQQLSLIPDLKSDIEKLNSDISQLESRLEHKEQEMTKLKQKHLNDLNFLRLEIEEERVKSREAENKRLMELEEFEHPTLQIVQEEQEAEGFNQLVGESAVSKEGSVSKPLCQSRQLHMRPPQDVGR